MRTTGLKMLLGICFAAALALTRSTTAQTPIDPADFDGSGTVDFGDFLTFAAGFGTGSGEAGYDAALDFDASGQVDFADFLVFAASFGDSDGEPSTTFVYIADTTAGEVKAFDRSNNFQDASRRLVASAPQDVFFSSSQQRFYVSALDSFYAFNPDGTPIYTIPLTGESDLGFVVSRGGTKMAVSPNQANAYVSELFGPVIEIIDLNAGQSEGFIDVAQNPAGLVLNAAGTRLFVSHGGANSDPAIAPLTVIDTQSRTVIDTLSVGSNGVNRLAINPIDGTLYTNNAIGGTLVAIDPVSGDISQSVDVSTASDLSTQILDIGVAPDGQFVYYTVSRISSTLDVSGIPTIGFVGGLGILDANTFEQVDEIVVGEITATLGISPDGSTAYISGSDNLTSGPLTIKIFIIDLTTRQTAGTLQGFELPSDISFSAGKSAHDQTAWPSIIVF